MAIATNIAVSDWRDEPDEIIATALAVLNEQARQANRKG